MVAAAAGCRGKSHALSLGPPELRAEPQAPSLYPPLPSWFWRHPGPTPEDLAARDQVRQAASDQAASRLSVPPVVRAAVAAAAESASGPSRGVPRKSAPPEARLRAKCKLAAGWKPTGHSRWVKRPLSQVAKGGSRGMGCARPSGWQCKQSAACCRGARAFHGPRGLGSSRPSARSRGCAGASTRLPRQAPGAPGHDASAPCTPGRQCSAIRGEREAAPPDHFGLQLLGCWPRRRSRAGPSPSFSTRRGSVARRR